MFEEGGLRGDPCVLPAVPNLAWYHLFDRGAREALSNTLLDEDDVQYNAAGTKLLSNMLEVVQREGGKKGGKKGKRDYGHISKHYPVCTWGGGCDRKRHKRNYNDADGNPAFKKYCGTHNREQAKINKATKAQLAGSA